MINTSYEPFSQEPEYIELNRQFIQSVVPYLTRTDCIVDVACGTGTLTDLLIAQIRRDQKKPREAETQPRAPNGLKTIGLDLSRESLKIAVDHFAQSDVSVTEKIGNAHEEDAYGDIQMIFAQTSGDCLPIAKAVSDAVLIGNAIHCFRDKGMLLWEVCRVLRQNGVFAFNSSFYAGTIVEGTESFYEEWMKQALRYVKRREEEQRKLGMKSGLRERGRGRPAFSNRWLTPAEYREALDEHGLDVVSLEERRIDMSQSNFETVGAYADLASVLLSGYPVELACEALERAVGPAFETQGVETISRSWLEVISVKR